MENLSRLKVQVLEYCERVKQNGGAITDYECPSCKSTLISPTPDKKGEKWDSLTVCYECGERHFTIKTKGRITTRLISI